MIKLKTENLKLDISNPKWYAVDYCGHYAVQTKGDYEGYDIFSEWECGLAKSNAELASKAPDLVKMVDELRFQLSECIDILNDSTLNEEQNNVFRDCIKTESKAVYLLKDICDEIC